MKYYTIPSPPALKDIVRFFWVLESNEPYTHYSMADVCPEMVFHYNGRFDELLHNGDITPSFTAGIHGQTNFTRRFHIDDSFGIFGTYLYPHAIPLLFNIPAPELTNQMTDLQLLLQAAGSELEEKIWNARSTAQRVKIMESFILQRLAKHYKAEPPVFQCIQSIIHSKGLVTIKQLASDHFLSERQFERKFRQFSGFSPKLFSRIVRFQSTMAQYGNKEKSLTEIALECGYYDQSHFIHEFREFSGNHPRHYFSGDSDATKWRD
ncbi:MAG TPA: helix-turn-helix transcriptional regulator [Chitinophaga sp.]|uniref:helix-turn-helix transcriptional regulator n=1 Tax=Chitinophaga sp. TaxID=1869181 RepID=UPI002B5E6CD2|nr:helix-turn-helix transcriptional regulator [Chitinophaga sp.]HVI45833.1 helix-turn-helix transcriptional regulator [Chitinophaga sp.]